MTHLQSWEVAIGVATFLLAGALVGLTRKFAVSLGMIDLPGERTSHLLPTPRGGGVAIFVSAGLAFVLTERAGLAHFAPSWLTAAVALAIVAVALVGWFDDRTNLSISARLPVHVVAAIACAVAATSGAGGPLAYRVLSVAWWVFCGVSAINITNFMDGTDGLIGSTVLVYSAYVFVSAPSGSALAWLALILTASCGGFLIWNWPPAKIFMGDVGSGTLGLLTLLEGAALIQQSHLSFVAAFLPLLPIYCDATLTLLRRIHRRENIGVAHRTHLYQRLANGGWGHARVVCLYSIVAVGGAIVGRHGNRSVPAILLYTLIVLALGAVLDREVPIRHDADCASI